MQQLMYIVPDDTLFVPGCAMQCGHILHAYDLRKQAVFAKNENPHPIVRMGMAPNARNRVECGLARLCLSKGVKKHTSMYGEESITTKWFVKGCFPHKDEWKQANHWYTLIQVQQELPMEEILQHLQDVLPEAEVFFRTRSTQSAKLIETIEKWWD